MDDGEQQGIVDTRDALQSARERDLDLVLVGETAQPPVAKLMDYGKFRYEQQQQDKEARKRSRQQEMKAIKFRVKIDDHDYENQGQPHPPLLKGRSQGAGDHHVSRARTHAPRTGPRTALPRGPRRVRDGRRRVRAGYRRDGHEHGVSADAGPSQGLERGKLAVSCTLWYVIQSVTLFGMSRCRCYVCRVAEKQQKNRKD